MIDWTLIENHKTDKLLKAYKGKRVMIFTPVYPEGHEMRYRLVDREFVKVCTDATHWAPLTPPGG